MELERVELDELAPAASPPNGTFDLAYDAGTSTVVAVVQVTAPPNPGLPVMWPFCEPTQTWTWNGTTWREAFAESVSYTAARDAPSGTGGAVMGYDPVSNTLVHYGGYCTTEIGVNPVGDTWTWNGSTWAHQSDTGGPTGLAAASWANDPVTGRLIVFGGCSDKYCEAVNDETWTWTGTGWTQLTPTAAPPARGIAAMALDPASGRVILFGGFDGNDNLSDTWAWDGSTWSRVYPATSPPARAGGVMSFDGRTGHLLLRGGSSTPTSSDTWSFYPYGVPGRTAAGTVTEYSSGIMAGGQPWTIATGSDGALWFTELHGHRIGRITTDGTVSEYTHGISQTPGSAPWAVAAGPDGALWFTENTTRVARITTTGAVTEHGTGISADAGTLDAITAGPDHAMWFTEDRGRVARITSAGRITEYSAGITHDSGIDGITTGPDGAVWFTEAGVNRIGRITMDGHVTEFDTGLPTSSGPGALTTGPDGTLWFTVNNLNVIGRISTIGQVSTYSTGLTANSEPLYIAVGPDGNLWFTEMFGGRIGRITTSGVITEFSTGISSSPGLGGITAGPDGAMWFTESGTNRIGRITTGLPSAPQSVNASIGPRSVTVHWHPPTDAGASTLTGYRVTSTPKSATCTTVAEYCTITGLTPGVAYRFTVAATNAAGTGPASSPSAPVIQLGPPTAPRNVVASPRNRGALISWAVPISNGGKTITRYTATAFPGGRHCITTGARTCTVTGLINGRAYRFTVKATSSLGTSTVSPASSAVVAGAPTAPRTTSLTFPAAGRARLTWNAPPITGSGPVRTYQVRWSANNGRTWSTWTSTRLTRAAVRTHLARRHVYLVQVRALNGSGPGPVASRTFTQGR